MIIQINKEADYYKNISNENMYRNMLILNKINGKPSNGLHIYLLQIYL